MLRRVVGDRVTALSGQRALLVMAAHPVAFAGFFAHTGALDDPYARLERTATVMNAIAFGTRRQADRMTAHVRAMHRRVRGTLAEAAGPFPAGTPYRGDDPAHLLWILGALAESAMLVYAKYARTLSARREGRAVAGLPRRRPPVRPARARHAGGRRGLRGLHGRALREPGAGRHAAGARAGDRHRAAPAGPAAPAPGARAGQPDHGRAAPAARCASSTASRWDPVRAVALHGGAEYVKRVVVPVLPERVRMLPLARAA